MTPPDRVVPPTPLKIFPRDSETDSSTPPTLVCETAAFYPEDIKLIWSKDGNEVKTGINSTKERNSKGLYKVWSSMEETQPVQSGALYICLVSHISLRIPAVAKFTVSEPNPGFYVAGDASMKVIQYPVDKTAFEGESVTFGCKFANIQTTSDLTFYWWKQGEREYLHTSPDNRKIFNFKTFQLLNVSFHDSGVYICAVSRQGKIAANGTGSRLIVHETQQNKMNVGVNGEVLLLSLMKVKLPVVVAREFPPTPLKMFARDSEIDSTMSLTLVCKTAAFFPEDITLTWSKDDNEVKTGINSTKERNSKGLYEISSYLEEAQTVQSGVVYTCLVSHTSLRIPAVAIYAVSKSNTDQARGRRNKLTYASQDLHPSNEIGKPKTYH
eukprot:gi/632972940/ref/XP_007902905.1/ PREDICTED: uncharacterized protein LOC103185951 [Callorhinchus milii]